MRLRSFGSFGSMALTVAALAGAGGCQDHPSQLDAASRRAPARTGAADPWNDGHGGSPPANPDDDSALGGVDVKGLLDKVATAIKTPGPYEAPQHSADYDETKPHWAVINIGGGLVEREAFSMSPFGGSGAGTELRTVTHRLRQLAQDAKLSGVLLRVDALTVSLPDVIEVRDVMHELRAAGKRVVCHAEGASNATYLFLTACDRIAIAPLGDVMLTGPAAMPIHVKPLMDKLGVVADFVHVGNYKGAAEPLTRDAPSPYMIETLNGILDQHYATMVDVIAAERKLTPDAVKVLIDTALFPSPAAKAAGLVDEVIGFEDFRDETVKGPWTKLELEEGASSDQMKTMIKLARFVGAMPAEKPVGDHIALVYALGNIVDGGAEGVLGARQEIASHTLVAALRVLAADASVKAVVLRIDSGGGSAQASELIWKAVEDLKAKKPVIVSMSDVAASGGYYIASGATKIFALPDTLTGSIGVVGGKIAPAGALAKLGVNTFPMGKGKHATMMASLGPWSDEERATILKSMEEVYAVFTGRVSAGRKLPIEKVQELAQGRVWTGVMGKQLGLVDELGGLDAALAEARAETKVPATADLEIYPPAPTLRDVLSKYGQVQAPLGLASASQALDALAAFDPHVAAAAQRLFELVVSFRTTHIQTLAVLPEIE